MFLVEHNTADGLAIGFNNFKSFVCLSKNVWRMWACVRRALAHNARIGASFKHPNKCLSLKMVEKVFFIVFSLASAAQYKAKIIHRKLSLRESCVVLSWHLRNSPHPCASPNTRSIVAMSYMLLAEAASLWAFLMWHRKNIEELLTSEEMLRKFEEGVRSRGSCFKRRIVSLVCFQLSPFFFSIMRSSSFLFHLEMLNALRW